VLHTWGPDRLAAASSALPTSARCAACHLLAQRHRALVFVNTPVALHRRALAAALRLQLTCDRGPQSRNWPSNPEAARPAPD